MEEYEIKITKEIREKTNKQKKLWENINILRGKKTHTDEEEIYFNEDGKEMELKEAGDLHEKYLKDIWNTIDYDLTNIWNEDIKKEMEKKNKEEEDSLEKRLHIREELDMAIQNEKEEQKAPMKLPEITKEELIDIKEDIKNKVGNWSRPRRPSHLPNLVILLCYLLLHICTLKDIG